MNGICKRCGKQLKWTGHLWLHCQRCGQLQVWPVSSEKKQSGGEKMYQISDRELDNYYARDYYGVGTDYFDPPEWEDEEECIDEQNCC